MLITPTSRLNAARWLIIAMLVTIMFSPAITNLIELLLVLTVVFTAALRQRVVSVCRQPMVMAALAFYLIIIIGVIYSAAGYQEALGMCRGWRKLLLLPLAVAVFDDARWKFKLTAVFVAAATFFCILSYVSVATGILFPTPEHALGITLRNHATQGMFFAVAAFSAAALAISRPDLPENLRYGLAAVSVFLLANIAFITTGRSGYIVLIACSVAMVAGHLAANGRVTVKSISLGMAALMLVGGVLALAPSSHQRILQAVNEAHNYQQATTVTSMGVRMHFWQNTLSLIEKKPIIGYGTGAFEAAYRAQVAGQSGVAATITSDPHNQFLKITAEHGFVGLLVFLTFLGASLCQTSTAPYRMLGLGAMAAWIATSLANSHFSTFSEGIFIFIWMGAMLAHEKSHTISSEPVISGHA